MPIEIAAGDGFERIAPATKMRKQWIILLLAGDAFVEAAPRLDNNLKCVDLSDLAGPLPLQAVESWVILKQSEDWEVSSYKNPR